MIRPGKYHHEVGELIAEVAEVRKETWAETLELHNGNITHAAASLGINARTGRKLNARFDLTDFAKDLRLSAGGKERGRPSGKASEP